MIYVKILAAIAFVGSIAWVIAAPAFDSALAVISSISALVSLFLVKKGNVQKEQQKPSVSMSSIDVQPGGDLNIGNINGGKPSIKNQEQHVSEGSTAIQATGNVTITKTGLTNADVRDIARDVSRATFYELAEVAKKTDEARERKIIEGFLSELQSKSLSASQANILNIEEKAEGITKTAKGQFAYIVPIEDTESIDVGNMYNGSPQTYTGLWLSADNPTVFTIHHLGYVMVKFNLLGKDTFEVILMTYIEKPSYEPFSFRLIIGSKIDVTQTIPALTYGFFKEKSNSFILNEKDLENISPTIIVNKFTV